MKNKEKNNDVNLPVESFEALHQAAAILSRDLYSNLLPKELSPSGFAVLKTIYLKGSMSQVDLAQEVVKTNSNMTPVVDTLEKRGLVERVRDVKDRRYYNVTLTPKGRKLIKKLYSVYVDRVGEAMGRLTKREREGFKRLCTKLTRL